MTTARELITRSFRKAKILARGENLTAEEANDGLAELNALLSSWSTEGLMAYSRVSENFTLTPNDGEYTIGSGGDFNTIRPMFISSAFVRDSGTDYALSIISEEAYNAIPDKDQTGIPRSLVFDNGNPLAKIKLYPYPSSNYTLHLLSEKPLTSISTLDTVLSFPSGWEDALDYNLQVRLSPQYGQEVDAVMLKTAQQSKSNIMRVVNRARVIDWVMPSNLGNIVTGWWNR